MKQNPKIELCAGGKMASGGSDVQDDRVKAKAHMLDAYYKSNPARVGNTEVLCLKEMNAPFFIKGQWFWRVESKGSVENGISNTVMSIIGFIKPSLSRLGFSFVLH